ncbi:membrane protein [Blastococcus jejuensis]|uniref:Membrane protein n=1 Tax=Blastococcus jejuensis TaxID=351224 RepID=A0ABP6NV90_9ACTN
MQLTAAHWVFLAGVVVILATMVMRKNIVVPAVVATFLTALVWSGSLATGLSSVFNASLVAATSLFNIFLIIAMVTAMLRSLEGLGSDKRMVAPFRKVMRNGHLSFWTLVIVTYFISLFFWPTPAVPLVGAVLVPVAIRAGLRPLAVGFTIAIAGQGMALSSDYIIGVAPQLSATTAGADISVVADRGLVLSLIVGGVALAIGYAMEFRKMRRPADELLAEWENAADRRSGSADAEARQDAHDLDGGLPVDGTGGGGPSDEGQRELVGVGGGAQPRDEAQVIAARLSKGRALIGTPAGGPVPPEQHTITPVEKPFASKAFALLVPLAYLALIVYLVVASVSESVPDLQGGDAAALVGGIAVLVMFGAAFTRSGPKFLETAADHIVDGLVFAFKAMGVVLPIAGFFFIGNGEFATSVLSIPEGEEAPNLLFDLVVAAQEQLPANAMITAFGIMIVGVVAGLDGSGFSGLPLTGSLAGSLSEGAGVSSPTLAAIGQMGNIWSGGGTLVAWSSLLAVAGFVRVPAVELARRCFVPVIAGLAVATVLGVVIFG